MHIHNTPSVYVRMGMCALVSMLTYMQEYSGARTHARASQYACLPVLLVTPLHMYMFVASLWQHVCMSVCMYVCTSVCM